MNAERRGEEKRKEKKKKQRRLGAGITRFSVQIMVYLLWILMGIRTAGWNVHHAIWKKMKTITTGRTWRNGKKNYEKVEF